MKKRIIFLTVLTLVVGIAPLFAAETPASPAEVMIWRYIAAAIAVGLSCLGGAYAVARIGSAAMGALSEKPEAAGKALPFVGLAEGICLWGFLVAVLILFL